MNKLCVCALFAALCISPAAFAKGTPQNHHCMKDGAEQAGKTKKACLKDGGTWEKNAAPAKDAPPKDAAAPTPGK